jgi:putative membrane protein
VKRGWSAWEVLIFAAFLFWSAAGLIFTVGKITPVDVNAWPLPPGLIAFVQGCVATGDPILILLAFANTHVHAAREWTPHVARRWGLMIIVGSLIIETMGVATGLPFGDYRYTTRFGPMIGMVPLTIPLAWHVVVTNALFLVRATARPSSTGGEAFLTGLICTVYDFILEPFATSPAKQYWVWHDGVIPRKNYAAWFVLSAALTWLFAPAVSSRFPRDPRPAVILGMTLLIFLAR